MIWSLLNQTKTNWFANFNDDDRSAERRRMVFLWPILRYLYEGNAAISEDNYRVMRLFWLRYNNNDRSVSSLPNRLLEIKTNGPWVTNPKLNTDEEILKHKYLLAQQGEIYLAESLIWEIEDHPYNIDGTDLGLINISHLVDFKTNPSVSELKNVCERFFYLFPLKALLINGKILQTILLYYGDYFKPNHTQYYERFSCDQWKRIIRNVDGNKKAFKHFFREYLLFEPKEGLQKFLDQNICNYLPELSSEIVLKTTLREQLIAYSIILNDLWTEGNYISIYEPSPTPRLFNNENRVIYNTKGSFRGNSGYANLWARAKEKFPKGREAIFDYLSIEKDGLEVELASKTD